MRSKQFEIALAVALAAVVIVPTALVLALGIRAVTEARWLFEAQVRDTARQAARTLVNDALSRAQLEIESARGETESFARTVDPAERLAFDRKASLAAGLVILDESLRPVYPVPAVRLQPRPEDAALERARETRFAESAEAAATAYREILDSAEEGGALWAVAANELAQTFALQGEKDDALDLYRRLADSEYTGGEISLPLLARFRIWRLSPDGESLEGLLDAIAQNALSAPSAQLRFYLDRLEGQGAAASEDTAEARALLELRRSDEYLAARAALPAAGSAPGGEGGPVGSWVRCGEPGEPAVAGALRLEIPGSAAFAVVSLDLDGIAAHLDRSISEGGSPASSISYLRGGEQSKRSDVALTVPFAAPLDFWQLLVTAPGGDLSALARARVRLLSWAVALAGFAVLGGLTIVVVWARRRAALARLQTDFVANVTHELKTPLTAIRSLAETVLLERLTEPDKRGEFLSGILQESDRLARLINNILDFSRLERGGVRLHFEEADLAALTGEAAGSFKAALPAEDRAEVTVSLPDGPLPALVDRDAVANIVYNLLDNARKYSAPPREIRLSLSRRDDDAVLSVSDNGIGLAPPQRRRVFRKFYRVDSALSAGTQGAGLGLSLVRAYALAHGGDVSVESEPARGSTFTVRIPLSRDHEDDLPGNDTGS